MNLEFWESVWEERSIRFHQIRINPRLKELFPRLKMKKGGQIFVPLCGKTHDIRWLTLQGHTILGVELSKVAVQEFFEEGGVKPTIQSEDSFERWSGRGVDVLQGDFFDLTPEQLKRVVGVYDRAALIALPSEMRIEYVNLLKNSLPDHVRLFLLTIEYPVDEMEGPPFPVYEEEVRSLFSPELTVERLLSEDVLDRSPFQGRLTSLVEKAYIIS